MKKKINWKEEIIDFIKTLVFCFVFVFILTRFIIKPIQVNQNSMYPTILDQSMGFSNVIDLKLNGVKRFDVVIIDTGSKNSLNQDKYIIKRVIALPNETIEVKDNILYINGEIIEEDFLNTSYANEFIRNNGYFTQDIQPITLGDDEIFCLGDNRPLSKDSRHYGPFTMDQLVSKGVFIVFPLNRFGFR